MLDVQTKQRLIELFSTSLDTFDDALTDDAQILDLHTLLAEMAALKNEVRLQARQFKIALEQTQVLSEALREQNARLSADIERTRSQASEAKAQAERGLLLGLLELRDSLQSGLDAQAQWRPSPIQRWLGGEQRLVQSLREGSALTLQRLDELLGRYRVRAIAAVGQPLDPHSMNAVATEWVPQTAEGVVVRELRRGYVQGTELLRTAEVIVNKSNVHKKGTTA